MCQSGAQQMLSLHNVITVIDVGCRLNALQPLVQGYQSVRDWHRSTAGPQPLPAACCSCKKKVEAFCASVNEILNSLLCAVLCCPLQQSFGCRWPDLHSLRNRVCLSVLGGHHICICLAPRVFINRQTDGELISAYWPGPCGQIGRWFLV
jgi:hypothetical protein